MKTTFTAKVTTPTGNVRIIPNACIYKGKLVGLSSYGVGEPEEVFDGIDDVTEIYKEYKDYYVPYFIGGLVEKHEGLRSKIEALKNNHFDGIFEMPDAVECMLQLGDNPLGYKVINQDAEKEEREKKEAEELNDAFENKTETINFTRGIFGFVLSIRLPKNVWALIAKYATYHKGDEDDEEWADDMGYLNARKADLSGYFYSKEAIDVLLQSGYKVSYKGQDCESSRSITEIEKNIDTENRRYYRASMKQNEEMNRLENSLNELWMKFDDDYDKQEVRKLPELHFNAIDYKGPDIYGGGRWLHEDNENIYIVHNNGMDGDDWSNNNYETGGAGAICYKAKKTSEVVKLMEDIRNFENKKTEDYYEN